MLHASALDSQLTDLIGQVGVVLFYLIVWALVFSGTALFVGVFIPFITGDSLLFASGILAAVQPGLNIWVLALGTGIAAFAGDQVAFLLGRRYGRPYLDRRGGARTQKAIARTEWFYRTFGWWSVVIARFVPWGRVFVPVIAGVGRMAYLRFVTANLVGALAWGVGITVIGYFAASNPQVRVASYVIAAVAILASVLAGIRAWRIDRRERRVSPQAADAPSQ
ncbi:DedA family protein [Rathayibacter sp. YIM 133350]|uniref:DedA family protein n=1 Tax=Rathayibacter sp. YIM 133350 TaxID=3131992 RepID=UPI00307FB16C